MFEKIPLFGLVAPVSLITKYNELGHIPAFTHAVPGAVWSVLAPLQVCVCVSVIVCLCLCLRLCLRLCLCSMFVFCVCVTVTVAVAVAVCVCT